MRVLVTGGAGFIGSHFVGHLLSERDDAVITFDALTYAGRKRNLAGVLDHPDHEFVEGDVTDREAVRDLFEDVDAVVHFAAESHVDRAIDDPRPFAETNVVGTATVLDAARAAGVERFLQVSTDEVYGHRTAGTFAEDDPLWPRNPYAATKAGADLLARSFAITHDLPVLTVRPSNNYGPRQATEKLVPKFVCRAAEGRSLPLYGDGSHVREWTFVTDTCRAIDLVLREGTPGEVYNVASGEQYRNVEVARRIVDLVGADRDQIEFVDDRPGHDRRYALDTARIEALGWSPRWSFEDGLERTAEHYLDGHADG